MEPRPPRPRSSRQFETPESPATPGMGERLYPAPADATVYPSGEEYAPGLGSGAPLLPRQQRRQRKALRGVAITLLFVGLIAALGWFFRDAFRDLISPPPPAPTVVAQTGDESNANVAAPGTPGAPTSAALPNALATVTPTPPAAATATAAQDAELALDEQPAADSQPAEPDRDISAQTLPLLDFLPTQDQIPEGMFLSDEAERSKSEVVDALGGTEEASQLLDDWGWSGNAFRNFSKTDPEVPGGASFIYVSVHRFSDSDSAAKALVYFADQGVLLQGLEDVGTPALGESARQLQGAPDGYPVTVLYAQEGPIMYRVFGSSQSADTDPTDDVLATAAAILPSQPGA